MTGNGIVSAFKIIMLLRGCAGGIIQLALLRMIGISFISSDQIMSSV